MTQYSNTNGLWRFFSAPFDPQTYRNLTYLLLAFPLGIGYFALLTAGISAGIGTMPILVGIPLLLFVLMGSVLLADVESWLATELLGATVERNPVMPQGKELGEYVKQLVTTPASYLDVFYLFSKFAIGIASFVAVVTTAAISLTLIAAPFLYDASDLTYQFDVTTIDTLPEALAVSAAGFLLALCALHVFNLVARGLASYTELVLGTGER